MSTRPIGTGGFQFLMIIIYNKYSEYTFMGIFLAISMYAVKVYLYLCRRCWGSFIEQSQVRAAVTGEDGETRVCHIDAAPRQLGLLKLPASAVSGPNRQGGRVLDSQKLQILHIALKTIDFNGSCSLNVQDSFPRKGLQSMFIIVVLVSCCIMLYHVVSCCIKTRNH